MQEINNPPSDAISNIKFSYCDSMLLVSSWDKGVRVYDVQNNCIKNQYIQSSPVLDCCWIANSQVLSGSLDCVLQRYDLNTQTSETLKVHKEAIRCVEYSNENNCGFTGSWDKTLQLWDFRAEKKAQTTTQLPDKVFTMSLHGNKVVVGTAGRHIEIYDIRDLSVPEQKRESVLNYQTRCIRCFIEGDGYAVSSTEGRIAMEYFDPDIEIQKLRYSFKCHRTIKDIDGVRTDYVYPVNAIDFHPTYGTFASGGGDGKVNIWDGKNKKRICQFPPFTTSISSLSFSTSGKKLAIAMSYTFEEGEKDHDPDTIWIRDIADTEVRPKPRNINA